VLSDGELLDVIRQDDELAALLWRRWEFSVERSRPDEPGSVASGAALECLAGDWTGGLFYSCGEPGATRPVLYASSEGQAGLIGASLGEALTVIVGLPSWRDCLGFSGGGDLSVMAATAGHLAEDERRTRPGIAAERDRVAAALRLDLPDVPDLLVRLHASARATEPDYVFSDGDGEFETLFGPWLPSRNPRWG
jgi:hypothetical protein